MDKKKKIKKIQKTSINSVDDKNLNFFKKMCLITSPNHFKVCDCHKKDFDVLYNSFLRKELKEQEVKGLDANIRRVRLARLPDLVRKELFLRIQSNPNAVNFCVDEFNAVKDLYSKFASKYNLEDPRAFTIVKTVISNLLTVIRMQKESSFRGVVTEVEDKFGNSIPVLNPVEEVKRRYNDSIIKAVEVLDRIFEGSKNVNINLSFKDEMIRLFEDIEGDSDGS